MSARIASIVSLALVSAGRFADDSVVTPPVTGAAPVLPAPPPAIVPPSAPAATSGETFTAAQLAEREKVAVEGARAKFLKDLGVEKFDDAKARITKAREIEDASKTELERLAEQNKALGPKAARHDELESALKESVDADFAALPENVREFIAATVSDDPIARRKAITAARAKGLGVSAASAPAAPVVQPPANSVGSKGAPPPAGATAPTKRPADMTDTEYREWRAKRDADHAGR